MSSVGIILNEHSTAVDGAINLITLAQIQSGTIEGDFVSFDETTSEIFWTTLPEGFAFGLIVWILSATVSVVFRLVKTGC